MIKAYENMEPPEEMNEKEFEAMFEIYDEDKNGYIDKEEFVDFIRSFGTHKEFQGNSDSDFEI